MSIPDTLTNTMKIGELAARSGVAASTIRFYEASGLLPPATRGPNGYRRYAPEALRQLLVIQTAQRLGFSLDAVRGMLTQCENVPHALVLEKLRARLSEIDTLQAALATQRQQVEATLVMLDRRWSAGECVALDELAQPLAELLEDRPAATRGRPARRR